MASIGKVSASRAFGKAPLIEIEVSPDSWRTLNTMKSEIAKAKARADSPDVVTRAAMMVARHWSRNFAREGADTGRRWQHLSAMTKEVRQRRGIGRGKIMYQTGSLRRGVADQFINWPLGQTTIPIHVGPSTPAIPGTESGGAVGSAIARGRSVTWSLDGPKAMHQLGGFQAYATMQRTMPKRSSGIERVNFLAFPSSGLQSVIPQRPFWYFNDPMLLDAAEGAGRYLVGEMLFNMPGAELTGFSTMQRTGARINF